MTAVDIYLEIKEGREPFLGPPVRQTTTLGEDRRFENLTGEIWLGDSPSRLRPKLLRTPEDRGWAWSSRPLPWPHLNVFENVAPQG